MMTPAPQTPRHGLAGALAALIDCWVPLALAAVLLGLLTGCGGVQATIPEVVQVPVPVSCIDAPVARPDFVTDTELAAMDDYKLPLALAIDRRLRQAYEAHLEATVTGCWQPKAGGL